MCSVEEGRTCGVRDTQGSAQPHVGDKWRPQARQGSQAGSQPLLRMLLSVIAAAVARVTALRNPVAGTGRRAGSSPLLRMLLNAVAAALLALAPVAVLSEASAAVIPPAPVARDGAAQLQGYDGTVVRDGVVQQQGYDGTVVRDGVVQQQSDDGTVEQQAARGGAYRSPGGTFSGGGARGGVAPGAGYRTGPRAPSPDVTRTPRTTTPGAGAGFGRAGTFFGGLAAGALLGHLFNPFAGLGWGWGAGYGGFGGVLGMVMPLVSLLIWAGILYAVYRIIRRMFGGGGGRGGGGWAR